MNIGSWLLRALTEAARTARRALSDHRALAILVAFIALKQSAGSWILIGRPILTPNSMVALIGESLLFLAPAFALRGRLRLAAVVAIDLVVTAFIVADLVYYRQFADLPSMASLKHAALVARVEGIAATLMRPVDFAFFASGAVALALLRPWRIIAAPALSRPRAAVLATIGLVLSVGVALSSNTVRRPVGQRIRIANRLGSVGYHAHDAAIYFGRSYRASFVDRERVVADALALVTERESLLRPAPARGMNVLVVQLEAFQSFAVGREVDGVPVTPNLDRLAAESLRFPRFFSQIGQGTTADAELLVQCSLQPARIGAAFYEFAANHFRCLPRLLANAGYSTVAMHANDPDYWGRSTTYPIIGFDTFYSTKAFSQDDVIGMGPSDATFFTEAIAKLRATPEPWYATLLSLTSHFPFSKAPKIPHVLRHGRFEDTTVANYLDAIRYTDDALGRLVDGLRREGMLERTVLIVFGDHWGVARANSNIGSYLGFEQGETARAFVAERHVPLFIRVPGVAAADVERTGGQVDVAPTIAGLVGVSTRDNVFLGRDLLDGRPGRIAFSSGSGADDELLYLSADSGGGAEGCYRLATLEHLPLSGCRPIKAEAERELAVNWGLLEGDLVARASDERAKRTAAERETASRPSTAPLPR